MNDDDPFRGCAWGILFAGLLWVVIFATAAIIVAKLVR